MAHFEKIAVIQLIGTTCANCSAHIKKVVGKMEGVDGVIVAGSSNVDKSMLTGKSLPVDKKVGDRYDT